MKKTLIIVILLLLSSCKNKEVMTNSNDSQGKYDDANSVDYEKNIGYAINENIFPDANFRSYIIDNIDGDSNLFLSDDEIKSVKELSFIKNESSVGKITNLKGIYIFSNLETLECNSVTNIDILSNPNLSTIALRYCALDEINIENNNCNIIDIDITGHYNKLVINYNNSKGEISVYDQPQYKELDEVFVYKDGKCLLYEEGYVDFHSTYDIKECNENNEEYMVRIGRVYYLGTGSSEIEDGKVFEHDDELLAYKYGENSNKWFRIDEIYPTEKEKAALPDSSFSPGLEQLLIKYRVRVFNTAPFN